MADLEIRPPYGTACQCALRFGGRPARLHQIEDELLGGIFLVPQKREACEESDGAVQHQDVGAARVEGAEAEDAGVLNAAGGRVAVRVPGVGREQDVAQGVAGQAQRPGFAQRGRLALAAAAARPGGGAVEP